MIARRIRDFIDVLFGSKRVAELKESLAKAEKSADYFRQRAERLELMLLPERRPSGERKPVDPTPIGRKPWKEVVREHNERLALERQKEAEAKKQAN